jgi:hypothetical protein
VKLPLALQSARPDIAEKNAVKYAIRIPAKKNLERHIAELLTRPVGRPGYKPVAEKRRVSEEMVPRITALTVSTG